MGVVDLFEEISRLINKEGYDVFKLKMDHDAYTVNELKGVFYDPDCLTLFGLTEEYFHIKFKHKGRLMWTDNDERNPNEHEAWNAAIHWLKLKWDCIVDNDNYYEFMLSCGIPYHFEDSVKEEFISNRYDFTKNTNL